MLSHSERKVLTVCFHLNRKGILSVAEICSRTRKKPEDVKRIVKRLYDMGFLRRNQKGLIEVYMDWKDEPARMIRMPGSDKRQSIFS